KGMGEFQPGESREISDETPLALLSYLGATDESDSTPNYSSAQVVTQGSSLTTAIGELDLHANDLALTLGLLKLEPVSGNTKRIAISAAENTLSDNSVVSQEIQSLLMSFQGAQIDFESGTLYAADGTSPLEESFTPTTIPSGKYLWYGIGLDVSEVEADGRASVSIVVTPA